MKEFAECAGVSERKILLLIEQGKICALKDGASYRILDSELERYVGRSGPRTGPTVPLARHETLVAKHAVLKGVNRDLNLQLDDAEERESILLAELQEAKKELGTEREARRRAECELEQLRQERVRHMERPWWTRLLSP